MRGIVTERDLVRKVLADKRDPKTVKIDDVMSTPVVSISPKEDVVDAAHLMSQRGIRRTGRDGGGRLVGIITANDLVKNMRRNVEELASMLCLIGRTWM